MVIVEEPEPGAAIDVGLKLTDVPAGAPLALKAMALLKPPETVVLIVEVALVPWTAETEVGDALIVNAGVAPLPTR